MNSHIAALEVLCGYPRYSCVCEDMLRYGKLMGVTALLIVFQLIGVYVTGSLALLGDTGHVAGDFVAFNVAAIATLVAARTLNGAGVRNAGRWILILMLQLLVPMIVWEAWERLQDPSTVHGPLLIVFALIGARMNVWQERIHHKGEESDHLDEGVDVHIKSDFWQSIGVAVGGVLILITGNPVWDLVASICVAIWLQNQVRVLAFHKKKSHFNAHIEDSCGHDHHHKH